MSWLLLLLSQILVLYFLNCVYCFSFITFGFRALLKKALPMLMLHKYSYIFVYYFYDFHFAFLPLIHLPCIFIQDVK